MKLTRIIITIWFMPLTIYIIFCDLSPGDRVLADDTLESRSVGLYLDRGTPQIVFAAGDIKAALEKQKHTVETHVLAALAKAGSGKKTILAIATDKIAAMLTDQGGKPVADLGTQAYGLRTTTAPDLSYWVLGGDTPT